MAKKRNSNPLKIVEPEGQPIPQEILLFATPDQLQVMAYSCAVSGNTLGLQQVTAQQILRAGSVWWIFQLPTEEEIERRNGMNPRSKGA